MFLSTLTIDIIGSLMIGALLTVVIRALLSIRMNQYVMGILILALGYSVFAGADHLAHWTDSQFQIHLKIEPLLLSMVSGIFLSNFTQSSHRLMEVLSSINVYVYLAFFTLIGASLEFDILSQDHNEERKKNRSRQQSTAYLEIIRKASVPKDF